MLKLQEWLKGVRRALCRLRGHDFNLTFEPTRVGLECVCCGEQSTGWVLDRKPPVQHYAGRQIDPVPIVLITTQHWCDDIVASIFAMLPDDVGDWRGNRNVQ